MGTRFLSTTNIPRSNTICLTGRLTTIQRSPTKSSAGSCRVCANGSPNSSTRSSARSTTPLKVWRRPTPPTRTATIKPTLRQSTWRKMRKASRRRHLLLQMKKRRNIRKPRPQLLLRRRKSRRASSSKKRRRKSLRDWMNTSERMTKCSRPSSVSIYQHPSQCLQVVRMRQLALRPNLTLIVSRARTSYPCS